MAKEELTRRKIVVVSGIRSEYSLLFPLLKRIKGHRSFDLKLIVTGAHLAPSFGYTVREIERDGFVIEDKIDSLLDSDSGCGRVKSVAIQLIGLSQSIQRIKPDIIIAPFDREEAINVALIGSYMNIPVAHLGSGDRVIGNADDYIRHAVTKLAHLHFTGTEKNRERVIKMGEEPWRVYNVGNIGIDKYRDIKRINSRALSNYLKFDISVHPFAVLIHNPLSTEYERSASQTGIVLKVINKLKLRTIIIHPNSDPGSREIRNVIKQYQNKEFIKIFDNLRKELFVNLMCYCDVLIGNSSCGILEAPFLGLPVVNIGKRQNGREHAENVLYVDYKEKKIESAIKKALHDSKFIKKAKHCKNPYGNGTASQKIVRILSTVKIDKRLIQKQIVY